MELFGDLAQVLRSVAPRGMELRPATVTAVDSETGWGDVVSVRVDGDPAGGSVDAQNLTGVSVPPGSRVMVMFDPPSGLFVLGASPLPIAAWVECCGGGGPE